MVLSVSMTAALGWYYWESVWLGLIGLWPLLKSTLSLKTLWVFFKKLPWLVLAGFKKYALKLFAATASMQLSSRFKWVQALLGRCRHFIARLTQLLTSQWHTLNFFERALVLLISLQVVLLVILVLILSRSLQLLAIKSGSETTAEQVVKRSIPKAVTDKLNSFGELTSPAEAPIAPSDETASAQKSDKP